MLCRVAGCQPAGAVNRLPVVGNDYLGAGGRLSGGPAPELVGSGYAHEIVARAAPGAAASRRADLAHAVALIEGGALAGDDARGLLAGLLELDEIPPAEFPWRPGARRRLQLARARADGARRRRRRPAG